VKTSRRLALSLCALAFASAQPAHAQEPNADAASSQQTQAAASKTQAARQQQTPNNVAGANAKEKGGVVFGSIKGRVVGESGEPMAGVSILASRHTSGVNVANAFNSTHTAAADDEGNFQIDGLEPGVYTLSASMPGYVTDTDPTTGRAEGDYRPGDTATVRLVKGGVVTGTVTDARGEPVVALNVRAFRVRDLDGRVETAGYNFFRDDRTDDRGVYRIYGLLPGSYVVVAAATAGAGTFGLSAYSGDAPIFYPSSTRDTASEITVHSGQEAAGIDIRYREEQGHRVTGRVEMPPAQADSANYFVNLSFNYASTGMPAANTFVVPNSNDRSFSLEGIADGDYDLQATGSSRDGITVASSAQRISVRGADVTGLKITLAPLASVTGTLTVEPSNDAERATAPCKASPRASLLPQESLVSLSPDRPPNVKDQVFSRTSAARSTSPDADGSFTLRGVEAGRYRFSARPIDEGLYVRSIQTPAASTPAPNASPARGIAAAQAATRAAATNAPSALDLKPGQQLSGVNIRLAEGAASLRGHVVAAEGAQATPFAQLRIYLVPAEREHADDALRFYETTPGADGSFSFKNLAPGRYLVEARINDYNAASRPPAWDADSRAKLRREAESAGNTVELQPCQRAADFTLRFPSPAK
jgi:Carboxypeptidase regulatory-like domain